MSRHTHMHRGAWREWHPPQPLEGATSPDLIKALQSHQPPQWSLLHGRGEGGDTRVVWEYWCPGVRTSCVTGLGGMTAWHDR